MHGTIIVFFVLTAGLSGTFSNLLDSLAVGARDMASPLLNMLSYWFFFLAECDHVLLPVFEHWTILGRLDGLSAA
jgi:heme/copper-type cytochrome/quinol oxidase subunit 1